MEEQTTSLPAGAENDELAEARQQLEEARSQAAAYEAEIAHLRERLLLRDAIEFINGRLAESQLPDVTRERLSRALVANIPAADGRLDETVLGERVATAISEAQAEITAIVGTAGGRGRITGLGSQPQPEQAPGLNESQQRINEALASMGFALNGATSNGH
jgi:hypothetical protein